MEPRTLGKYELGDVLGRGATGVVYEARDPVIDRKVAVKTVDLPPEGEAQDALARFRREVKAAGRLSHPNIVAVHDYNETASVAYIVMEFVDGGTLKSKLDAGERLTLRDIRRVMEDVLGALQYSHDHGVIHRDIKPANIIMTVNGRAKVADFGIARIENSDLTQAGTRLGTPNYMSPEQFMGQPVDVRTDIYSAGVVLYQLLTGERPFEGGTTAIMYKVLNTLPPRPSELSTGSPELDAVVGRAMARRPQDRYASAAEFAHALHVAVDAYEGHFAISNAGTGAAGDRTFVIPPSPPSELPVAPVPAPSAPAPARHFVLAFAAFAVLAIVLAGAGAWFFLPQREERRSAEEMRAAISAAIKPISCALVSGDVTHEADAVRLNVLAEKDAEPALRSAIAAAAPAATLDLHVATFDGPYCELLELLRPFSTPFGSADIGLDIAMDENRTELQEGDRIVVRITAPDYPSLVQLDYLQKDGTVSHMQPSKLYPAERYAPLSRHSWGEPRPNEADPPVVALPFGTDMITAIASDTLLFPQGRPETEPIQDYLRVLRDAIAAAQQRHESLAAAALVLRTRPRD